jgi:hypothetical protein
MPITKKHPIIHATAWLAILGGLGAMLVSLFLLHGTIQQQQWPAVAVISEGQRHYYQVGENRYHLPHWQADSVAVERVYVNPNNPQQHLQDLPNYWWHLYLCMAGLIVLYAGLHLRRERGRNVQSLSFE